MERTPIIQLDEATIGRIAAGEVVERPAQVVKELVENSIDAGSTRIRVVIENGGFQRILVEDDGHGIPPEELPLAINRHATSKLRNSDDLASINTLGFRGEALAAVGSVSKLIIRSRQTGADGSVIEVVNGTVGSVEPIGMADGTSIEVREIFAAVPARMAFQRRPTTESAAVMDVVTAYTLAHPEVNFSIEVDGRATLTSPSVEQPEDRLFDVLGGISERLIPLKSPQGDDKAPGDERWRGWISPPSMDRGRTDDIHIFVNDRAVAATDFLQSIRRGYHSRLMVGRHPMCVLFLDLPAEEVDVNVHPTKREVRLRNSWRVLERLERAIAHTLLDVPTGAPSAPNQPLGAVERMPETSTETKERIVPPRVPSAQPSWMNAATSVQSRFSQPISPSDSQHERPRPVSISPASQATLPGMESSPIAPALSSEERHLHRHSNHGDPVSPMDEPTRSGQKTNVPVMEPLAQFADTYILAQGGDELFIIDQHALHERIRYERLRNEMTSWEAQNLISPLELELSPSQIQIVEGYREILTKLGLEFDTEAQHLLSVPRLLIGDKRLQGFIRDLLTDLSTTEGMMLDSVERLQDDIAFMRSCRGAVKANQRLEIAEMRRLLADMGTIDNPWACVHGRPTVLRIGVKEMDDHFGRLG
ncbi:MAG: DNA mismatch repair protein MutL [Methanobacteriota archaeon]|nr:hypothetical protein [Euryarchaeota archaeon]CAI8209236.1 MAG: DNA mismatch repair protein MutL [Euryarchaeota archaeon]